MIDLPLHERRRLSLTDLLRNPAPYLSLAARIPATTLTEFLAVEQVSKWTMKCHPCSHTYIVPWCGAISRLPREILALTKLVQLPTHRPKLCPELGRCPSMAGNSRRGNRGEGHIAKGEEVVRSRSIISRSLTRLLSNIQTSCCYHGPNLCTPRTLSQIRDGRSYLRHWVVASCEVKNLKKTNGWTSIVESKFQRIQAQGWLFTWSPWGNPAPKMEVVAMIPHCSRS